MESLAILSDVDAGELLTLQRAAYVTEAQAHHDPNLPPLMQTSEELQRELRDDAVLALGLRDDSSRLVAAVRVRIGQPDRRTAELGRLVVAPDMQGRGLGSRLLSLTEQHLPESVTEMRLFTGEFSSGNLRLYARFGYHETHRTPTLSGYDLVHLAKTVG
ncbi:GNAT family N-acetyltransferase [Rhodococcus sp. TAF43]|uniref:GNAT family N-acetyltransferase n=1 Tax=unclassified Rhodococcus (in: high G+C Gram-positive bacteria) TaxID=192944 RepID=UPI0015824247|nr:GNAT family N-acetyltransferase [Rhodococcus sp. W8901]QKT12437.1 GNAT family N-acetyltransferase [Rhodococcus sp. W8901]